jgi:hypothetical protein
MADAGERPEGAPDPPAKSTREGFSEEEREALKALVRSPGGTEVHGIPSSGKDPDLQRKEDEGDIALKRLYGAVLLVALVAVLVFANYIFYRYAKEGTTPKWNIDPGVMKAWLAATVVEVLGLAAIVVRHLFPRRDETPRSTRWLGIRQANRKTNGV